MFVPGAGQHSIVMRWGRPSLQCRCSKLSLTIGHWGTSRPGFPIQRRQDDCRTARCVGLEADTPSGIPSNSGMWLGRCASLHSCWQFTEALAVRTCGPHFHHKPPVGNFDTLPRGLVFAHYFPPHKHAEGMRSTLETAGDASVTCITQRRGVVIYTAQLLGILDSQLKLLATMDYRLDIPRICPNTSSGCL